MDSSILSSADAPLPAGVDPALVPEVRLANGVAMPMTGYGVFRIPDGDTAPLVRDALRLGYRLVDTASTYGNEEGVGEGLRLSGVPRDKVFLTTKVWVTQFGRTATRRAVASSLRRLGTDHVDLLLLHFPVPSVFERTVEAWHVLEDALHRGLTRAIGVCNFHVAHLERLMAESDVKPMVNQVELHPCFPQNDLVAWHKRNGIVTEAWSPLGGVMAYDAAGLDHPRHLLEDPRLAEIAARHGVTPAAVVLRWHLQRGIVTIPKTVSPRRMAENLGIFGFSLDGEDMAALAALDTGRRGALDPNTVTPDTYPSDVDGRDDEADESRFWG